MTDSSPPPSAAGEPSASPQATTFLLTIFADVYRQEVGAEEDVHRSLPFFGTALGIVIGALAYAAGRLPRLSDLVTGTGRTAFMIASGLLALAIIEAICVLFCISRAIARRDYQRIGPESALPARLLELQAYYADQGVHGDAQDCELAKDLRHALLESPA